MLSAGSPVNKRRSALAGLVVLTALAVGGTFVTVGGGSGDRAPSSRELVQRAAARTDPLGAEVSAMTTFVRGPDSFTVSFDGAANVPQGRAVHQFYAAGVSGTIAQPYRNKRLENPALWEGKAIDVDGTVYTHLPAYAKLYKTTAPWIRVPYGSVPLDMLDWGSPFLRGPVATTAYANALVGDVEFVKDDDVMGAPARLYRGTIDGEKMRDPLGNLYYAGDGLKTMRSTAKTMRWRTDFYVDDRTGYIARIDLFQPARLPGYTGTVQTTIQLSDWGTKVRVTPPPASSGFSEKYLPEPPPQKKTPGDV
jgi:hypothetical protein